MKQRPGGTAENGPAYDSETAVIGMAEEPDYLLDEIAQKPSARVVLDALQAKLVRMTDTWQLRPELALRLPRASESDCVRLPDGSLLVVWHMNERFLWHDGTPFSGEDLRWSTLLLKQFHPHGFFPSAIGQIQSVFLKERAKTNAVVVRWDRAPFSAAATWGSVLPAHLLRWDAGVDAQQLRELPFARSPVGLGPFRFESWVPGREIVLRVNEHYLPGRPALNRLVFRFYADSQALKEAVIRKEVDLAEMTGFTLGDAGEIEAAAEGLVVHRTPTTMLEQLTFNLRRPWMRERWLRAAIAHALDRTALAGRMEAAGTWLPPRHPACRAVLNQYRFDPGLAAEMLNTGGMLENAGGDRIDPAGLPVTLKLVIAQPAGVSAMERWLPAPDKQRLAGEIARSLQRLGIGVTIETMRTPDLVRQLASGGDGPDLILHQYAVRPEAGHMHWHSEAVPSADNHWLGQNWSGWSHELNDRILENAGTTLSEDERCDQIAGQQEIWAQELPALPLFFRPWITTAKSGLARVRPVGLAESFLTWNVADWFWVDRLTSTAKRRDMLWAKKST